MIKTSLFEDGGDMVVKRLDVRSDELLCDRFGCFGICGGSGGRNDIFIGLRSLVAGGCVGRGIHIHLDSLSISRTLERLDKDEWFVIFSFEN